MNTLKRKNMPKPKKKFIQPVAAIENATKKPANNEKLAMTFKLDPEFHTEFKTYAASNRLKLNELLKILFYSYTEKN